MRKRTVKLAACALALAVLAGCAGGGPASQSTPAASESAAAPESVSESAAASASQGAAEAEPVTLGALSEDLLQLGFANLPAVPATLFFDGNGYTVGQGIVGAQDEDGWRALIEERLAMAAEQMEAMA